MLIQQSLLPRSRMPHLLAEISNNPVDFTLYIKSGTSKGDIEKELARKLDRGQIFDELVEKAAQSPTGAVIFYGRGSAYIIHPPFPSQEKDLSMGYEAGRFEKMLQRELLLGLVLVRLGHYAIGVFKGEKLVEGKAGTGLVHARHHKGGSSANRFARHREKQMEYFFTRVELHSREILEKYIRDMDYVLYGGTRDTLQ
jgi:peptide subunit release factor 1 (eRF1)